MGFMQQPDSQGFNWREFESDDSPWTQGLEPGRRREIIRKLKMVFEGALHAISIAAEMRDPYTAGHERRVAALSRAIAQRAGCSDEEVEGIYLAASIHDIGKIAIPAEILSKPGSLSDLEYRLIMTHPRVGYDILKSVGFPWPVSDVVLQHHERLNGSGYPQGLERTSISSAARIVAVADVVEGISSHRPYRPAKGISSAMEEITSGKDTLYDPTIVDVCVGLIESDGFSF